MSAVVIITSVSLVDNVAKVGKFPFWSVMVTVYVPHTELAGLPSLFKFSVSSSINNVSVCDSPSSNVKVSAIVSSDMN